MSRASRRASDGRPETDDWMPTEASSWAGVTPAASQVPSKLGEIEAPTQYLWSGAGEVPRQSVDRVQLAMPSAAFEVVPDAWRAHLDSPEKVAAAISSLALQG